jgi:hypothetical protein
MIDIDNTHIYKGISFSPFRLSSTNYKLGITSLVSWHTRKSGGIPDNQVQLGDCCRADVASVDRVTDRWLRHVSSTPYVWCTPESPVIYSHDASSETREQLVRWLTAYIA